MVAFYRPTQLDYEREAALIALLSFVDDFSAQSVHDLATDIQTEPKPVVVFDEAIVLEKASHVVRVDHVHVIAHSDLKHVAFAVVCGQLRVQ